MTPQARAAYALAGPSLLGIALVFALPTVAGLLLSLTDFDVYALADLRNLRWVGTDNYAALARNPMFWRALGNTLLFAALGVPAVIGAALGTALLLNDRAARWRSAWRVLLFAPYVTTLVATAVVWRYLLSTRFGLINVVMKALGLPAVAWLDDPRASVPALVLFVTWKTFGYNMVIFSAALAAVSPDLVDAARIDGAGTFARFRHVTVPAIGPALLLATLLTAAGTLQIFAEPYIMTQGGPAQSTQTLLYFMVEEGFRWWNLGMASAVAVIVFALTVLVSAVQLVLGRRRGWV